MMVDELIKKKELLDDLSNLKGEWSADSEDRLERGFVIAINMVSLIVKKKQPVINVVSLDDVIKTISGDGPPEPRYPSWYVSALREYAEKEE
jgi:hypothetical protein